MLGHVVNALGEKTGGKNKTPGFTNGPLVLLPSSPLHMTTDSKIVVPLRYVRDLVSVRSRS